MDYFKFDLQLFATVNITGMGTDSKIFYATIVDNTDPQAPVTTTEWIDEAARAAAVADNDKEITILAKLDTNDVYVVTDESAITINTGDADGTALNGKTVKTVGSIAEDGTVGGANGNNTVTFSMTGGVTCVVVDNVDSSTQTVIPVASKKITVPAAYAVGTMTAKEASTEFLLADSSLQNANKVTVDKGATFKVGTSTFTNASVDGSGDPATADVTGATNDITVGKGVTIVAGTATISNTSATTETIKIGADGTVSAIADSAIFSVTTGTAPATTTKTYLAGSDGKTLSVETDGKLSVYKTLDSTNADLTNFAVAADGSMKQSGNDVTLADILLAMNALTLDAQNAALDASDENGTVIYYGIKDDGSFVINATKDTVTGTAGVVGYFEVATTLNSGGNAADIAVSLFDRTGAQVKWDGKIAISGTNVPWVTFTDGDSKVHAIELGTVTVTGISASAEEDAVTLSYMSGVATVSGDAGQWTMDDTNPNVATVGLDANNATITIPDAMAAGNVAYFLIEPTGAAVDGRTTYRIVESDADHTSGATNADYFTVTAADAGGGKLNYTVAYASKGTSAFNGKLDAPCWKGLVVDAKNCALDETAQIKVSGNNVAGSHDEYAVNNVARGISVVGDTNTLLVTANFVGGDAKVYVLDNTSDPFALADASGVTYYYLVTTSEGDDGLTKVKLTKKTSGDITTESIDLKTQNYFIVEDSTDTKTIKVNYVQATDGVTEKISLKNLTGLDGAFKIPITSSATAAAVSTIEFSGLMDANVNNLVLNNAAAGIKVTYGGAPVTKTTGATSSAVTLGTFAYGTKNGVKIALRDLSFKADVNGTTETATIYLGISTDETTRVVTFTNNGNSDGGYGSYTFTRNVNDKDNLVIAYVQGTAKLPDGTTTAVLPPGATGGYTQIDLGNSEDITKLALDGNYDKAIDVSKELSQVSTDKGANYSAANNADQTNYTYYKTYAFADGSKIDFSTIITAGASGTEEGAATKTLYYTVDATNTTTVKGVTKYVISNPVNAPTTNKSYFMAVYNTVTGAITLSYAQNGGDYAAADIEKAGKVPVLGATVVNANTTGLSTYSITKKLTLPSNVACDVTGLPKEVLEVDVNGGGSTYDYATSYSFADSIALTTVTSTTPTTVYYYVTKPSTSDKGVYALTLTKVTTNPSAETLTQHNYFKVKTTNAGVVTISYQQATDGVTEPIDLDGTKITIDPTGAAANANITVQKSDAATSPTDDSVIYVIKNLTKEQRIENTDAAVLDPIKTSPAAYQESYQYAYTPDATDAHGIKADGIHLTANAGKTYYTVTKGTKLAYGIVTYTIAYGGTGDAPAFAGVSTPADPGLVGYISVNNGSTTGITISYSSNGEKLADIGDKVSIVASGAAPTVTAIDLSNTGTRIDYAITGMSSGVEVINYGANDTYAMLTEVDLTGKTITLDATNKVYWTISASGDLTRTTTEPTSKETNYFSVIKTGNDYKVTYVPAEGGTAFDVKNSTLTVNAAAVDTSNTCTLTLADGAAVVKGFTVTGAPAGVTLAGAGQPNTSISYTSTFSAWPTAAPADTTKVYTYFTPQKDADGKTITKLTTSATPVTVAPLADGEVAKKYNKVTITVATDNVTPATTTYTVKIEGVKQSTKDVAPDTPNPATITEIPLTMAALGTTGTVKLDASDPTVADVTFTGLKDGDVVTGAQAGQTFVGTELASATATATFTIDSTEYTQVGTTPVEIVMSDPGTGVVGKALNGVFAVTAAAGGNKSLAGGKKTAFVTDDLMSMTVARDNDDTTTEDGTVYVTFKDGVITSVTGLEAGETLTILKAVNTPGTDDTRLEYIYVDGVVTLKTTPSGSPATETVAAADDATVDVTKLAYQAAPLVPITGEPTTFAFTPDTYYLAIAGTAPQGTVTVQSGAAAVADVTSGRYLQVVVAEDHTLTITPVAGTAKGTTNPYADFAGTVTVNAQTGVPVKYTKAGADKFALTFTNVSDGSTFTNLGEGDTVTTAALDATRSVTVNGLAYTAAASGAVLTFDSGRIVSGTVTLAKNASMRAGDGSVISLNNDAATNGVEVTFTNGEITSIKGVTNKEEITVITYKANEDGTYTYTDANRTSKTVYTFDTATTVKKDVYDLGATSAADKISETTTIELPEAEADILDPDKNTSLVTKLKTTLNMALDGDTAYFEVLTNAAPIVNTTVGNEKYTGETDTSGRAIAALDTTSATARKFIKATITKGTGTNPDTLTLTPVSYLKGVLTETGISVSTVTVDVTPIAALSYDATGTSFKAVNFTGVSAGSVLANLPTGSIVTTAALDKDTAPAESVTINGKKYTAVVDGPFKVYAANTGATYLMQGTVTVKGDETVTSITAAAAAADPAPSVGTYRLSYAKGTSEAGDEVSDGVTVTYNDVKVGVVEAAVPTIKGLNDGETVRIENLATNKFTTYRRMDKYIYMTTEDGKVWGHTMTTGGDGSLPTAALVTTGWTDITNKKATTTAFSWADLTAETPKATTGYFQFSGDKKAQSASVVNQSAAASINYANYGETYLKATVNTDGTLTLRTATVGYDGELTGEGVLTNIQSVTVDVPGGQVIKYARGAEKSITLTGIGDKSQITGTLTSDDTISTASLKAGQYVYVGGNAAADKYTAAGESNTTMTFTGNGAAVRVTGGTFLLDTAKTSFTTISTDEATGKVTEVTVAYAKHTYTGENANVIVTVSNGKVTSITGMNADNVGSGNAAKGERVTVTTTVTDKFGKSDTTIAQYDAAYCYDTGKVGQITVTKTEEGTEYTHTFANDKQNILADTTWISDDPHTKRNFDWDNTSYFRAVVSDAKKPTVYVANGDADAATLIPSEAVTTGAKADITKALAGAIFLKVTSTQTTASSQAEITSMSLVRVEDDGTLAEYSAGTIGEVKIVATGAGAAGFKLPSHSFKAVITDAVAGGVYTGLGEEDTLTGIVTGTFKVNGTDYVVAGLVDDPTTTAVVDNQFKLNGKGEITNGIFTIKGDKAVTVNGTATAAYDGDNEPVVVDGKNTYSTVTKSVTYTPGTEIKNGVNVTFTAGEVTGVADLEAGEQVVVTTVRGASAKEYMTTTLTKDLDDVVKQEIKLTGAGFTNSVVLTKTEHTKANDVLSAVGFSAANKFDFGDKDKVGVFAVAANRATVKAWAEGDPAAAMNEGNSYVVVEAAKASGTSTISHIGMFTVTAGQLGVGTGNNGTTGLGGVGNGVTIVAPSDVNLSISKDAAVLYKKYKYNDKTKTYEVDTSDGSGNETAREYAINVTGAVTGKSYSGFAETDTVSSDTLQSGDAITVNSKKVTLAETGSIVVRGDGKAINGVFKLDSSLDIASGAILTDPAPATAFTATITGSNASAAQVTLSNGNITSIKGAVNGSSLRVVSTNVLTKAVTTTEYSVTSLTDTTFQITRKITEDGVTKTQVGSVGTSDSILNASWGAPTDVSVKSSFNWTSANGSGYFLTDITDTATELGDITIEPNSLTAEPGKYYLQVKLSGDGAVSGLELHKIQADGTPDTTDLMPSKVTKGTITVKAPSGTALKFNSTAAASAAGTAALNIPAGVTVAVTGAAAKSDIKLRATDTLTTASLAVGDAITVNDTKMVAGAAGAMDFAAGGKLANGTVKFDKNTAAANLTVTTSKGSFVINGGAAFPAADDVPVVTVKNGVVTTIEGNDTVPVLVQDATGNNKAEYAAKLASVTFNSLTNGTEIETAKLAANAAVYIGGAQQTYSVNSAGAIKATVTGGALRFQDADLKFTQNSLTLYTTGAKSTDSGDDKAFTFTRNSGVSTVTVKVENGIITSAKGLRAGDVFTYDGATYTAKTATAIEKVWTDAEGTEQKTTAYITSGGDIINASYAVVDANTDISGNETFEGQFSWAAVNGRSTGYFKVDDKKKTAQTIAEQSTKSSPTAKKNTVTYVKANASAEAEGAVTPQILSIDAIQVTNDGTKTTVKSTTAKDLLNGVKITVAAPTAKVTLANGNQLVPAISYTKTADDTYHIAINKAASQSAITGLVQGDTVTTAVLDAPAASTETVAGVETPRTTYQGVKVTDYADGTTITYVAGAKGALEFHGAGAAADNKNRTALYKGTIALDADDTVYNRLTNGVNVENSIENKTAILAGASDTSIDDDVVITLDATNAVDSLGDWLYNPATLAYDRANDKVLVTVDKGAIKSITGLESKGMELKVVTGTTKTVTYKVLNVEYTLDAKGDPTTTKTVTIERSEGENLTYGTFTVGKDFFDKYDKKGETLVNYVAKADTPTNTNIIWTDTDAKSEKNGRVIYAAVDTTTVPNEATFAKTDAAVTIDGSKTGAGEEAERGKRYLAMTVKTKNGVTTIQKIEVAEIGATGKPEIVKNLTVEDAGVQVIINGKNGDAFAKINYAIPATVPVTMTNLAVGSVITGIKAHDGWAVTNGDQISTADQENVALAKGTVSLYKVVDVDLDGDSVGDVKQTAETKVTYATKTKNDSATINVKDGDVVKLTGLETNNESVTIVEYTATGEKTTVFAVAKGQVTKTVTNANGTKKVYSGAVGAADYDWIADASEVLKLTSAEVVSEFDWTMKKRNTGYFEVVTKNGATSAAVKAQSKAVTIKNTDTKKYIAVEISDDGEVKSVKQVKMNATTGEMVDDTSKFSGVINVTAPAKAKLAFDRSLVDAGTADENTIASTATVAVTGAIADSWIANLALGDTVTTAKLAKAAYKNNAWTNGEGLNIGVADDENGVHWFTAGAAGALGFKVQNVDGDKKLTLTGGTIKLTDYVYAGNQMITKTGGADGLTVAASTKGTTTSYTIGEMKEGETFTIETFGTGIKEYKRSANNLFCKITTGSGEDKSTTYAVYEIKSGTSVKSSVLDLAGTAASKKNPWTTYTEANATFVDDATLGKKLVSTVKNAAVTVDLKLLDSRIAADNKLYKTDVDYAGRDEKFGTNRAYSFVIDKYLANPAKFNGAAAVVANANLLDVQEVIGTRWGGGKVYNAGAVGQTIKVTSGWQANGSNFADTITGASSGTDLLNGNGGNDSLVGGAAADTFMAANGQDTIKSYATGKDKIEYQTYDADGKFKVSLTGADVLLWNDDDGEEGYTKDDNSVLLLGMGNKKAVKIDGTNYFFGSGKATKAETFSFDVSGTDAAKASVYYGKENLANVVSIGTDKTRATAKTLGDTLEVNLSDTNRYFNIAVADASKSGNKVALTATSTGSTLKGGTYQSTLKGGKGTDSLQGGSGADTFWFDVIEGQDVINGYASGKDSVLLKDANIVFKADDVTNAETDVIVKAEGKDVVIYDGEEKNKITLSKVITNPKAIKAVSIMTDAATKEKLSYYIGSTVSGAANTYTATIGTDTASIDTEAGKALLADGATSMKSYYVGSDSTAKDTLKLTTKTALTTWTADSKTQMATFSLANANLTSIDVLDATGVAANSTLKLMGGIGDCTLVGSKSNKNHETFAIAYDDKATAGKTTTVQNLTAVSDVIELAMGVTAVQSSTSKKGTYYTLKNGDDTVGQLFVAGVAGANLSYTAGTATTKATITRSK